MGDGSGCLCSLHEVAQRILAAETEEIHTCRWGGEEFLILAVGKMAYPSLVNALQKILGEAEQFADFEAFTAVPPDGSGQGEDQP